MAVDRTYRRWSVDPQRMARIAEPRRVMLLLSLTLAACVVHRGATDPGARYAAMIGRSETELTRNFGSPTRRENIQGHEFLTYEQSDIWLGQAGSRLAPSDRTGPGVVAFECRATFVVVAGVVSAYTLSGTGC